MKSSSTVWAISNQTKHFPIGPKGKGDLGVAQKVFSVPDSFPYFFRGYHGLETSRLLPPRGIPTGPRLSPAGMEPVLEKEPAGKMSAPSQMHTCPYVNTWSLALKVFFPFFCGMPLKKKEERMI